MVELGFGPCPVRGILRCLLGSEKLSGEDMGFQSEARRSVFLSRMDHLPRHDRAGRHIWKRLRLKPNGAGHPSSVGSGGLTRDIYGERWRLSCRMSDFHPKQMGWMAPAPGI